MAVIISTPDLFLFFSTGPLPRERNSAIAAGFDCDWLSYGVTWEKRVPETRLRWASHPKDSTEPSTTNTALDNSQGRPSKEIHTTLFKLFLA